MKVKNNPCTEGKNWWEVKISEDIWKDILLYIM